MKEYFLQKLFELPSYTPIRVFQRRSSSVGDTPSSEWFDHILDEAHPLPEGLVMVSPVMTGFQSPTPPSPPGTPTRTQRSVSLDSKGARWAVVNGLQQRIRARLTWTRRRSADDASLHGDDSDDDTVVPSVIIETVHGDKPHRPAHLPATTLEFFDHSVPSPPLDAIDEEDDGKKHIHFSMAPMVRHMYFPVESYEEWVVRISCGYANTDTRPAHVKLHSFCNKSLTYLKYRQSPCAEVFALGAHDVSMWRTLGQHDWLSDDACPNPEPEADENNDDGDHDDFDKEEAPMSPLTDQEDDELDHLSGSDRELDDDDDVDVVVERVPIVPLDANLQPLLEIINATIAKGDTLFTLEDIVHFCCEVEYSDRDEDGWC
ncbi:hypothetical protein ACHHYP_06549 [Achlya hypogyna]|uniref:Uncharacterized protein n=1 Tax=Achlya hypogyna TaxID=1202772 RepID=A0A1V9YTJ4_ACHHY|nr:hypothetical protein ACHHYP_06549 [Achlya hypogyna]